MLPFALTASGLTKTWRPFFGQPRPALRGVSLTIAPGVAFGLIGPNGAGKTTFIKVLLGVVRPTGGSVTVLDGSPEDAAIRARIGYLPERLHLPAALRARDFLRSVATLKGLFPSDVELGRSLERVGLPDDSKRIGTFSKGMRQRLGLAAALLGRPELLILDEPTDGIDPVGRLEVRALLLEEKARGATLLLNSHLVSETERVCDRVGVLQGGVLQLEGSLDELLGATDAWAARFSSDSSPEVLRASGFVDGTFHGDLDAVNAALDVVRAKGCRVMSLSPVRRDLEQVLAQVMGPSA